MDEELFTRFRESYWHSLRELDTLRLQQWERSHLTLPQLRVLFQVRRSPGITIGHLARNLGVTVSTTSGLVGKLCERGLLARGSTPGDRRQIPLSLTTQGDDLAGELAESTRPFLEQVAKELGDSLPQVVEMLSRLAQAAAHARESMIGIGPMSAGRAAVDDGACEVTGS